MLLRFFPVFGSVSVLSYLLEANKKYYLLPARMFLEKKILPHGSVASLYVTNVTTSPFESLFNGPGDINSCDTDLQLPRCDG